MDDLVYTDSIPNPSAKAAEIIGFYTLFWGNVKFNGSFVFKACLFIDLVKLIPYETFCTAFINSDISDSPKPEE